MNKIAFFLLVFFFCTAIGLYVGAKSIPEVGGTNPMTGKRFGTMLLPPILA